MIAKPKWYLQTLKVKSLKGQGGDPPAAKIWYKTLLDEIFEYLEYQDKNTSLLRDKKKGGGEWTRSTPSTNGSDSCLSWLNDHESSLNWVILFYEHYLLFPPLPGTCSFGFVHFRPAGPSAQPPSAALNRHSIPPCTVDIKACFPNSSIYQSNSTNPLMVPDIYKSTLSTKSSYTMETCTILITWQTIWTRKGDVWSKPWPVKAPHLHTKC